MLRGKCHCGEVQFSVQKEPEWLTECNCSVCQRLGCLWLHADCGEIELSASDESTLAYVWNEKMLAFHTCKTCGCTTHWLPVDMSASTNMAINARMFESETLKSMRVRQFDGADTWQYLD